MPQTIVYDGVTHTFPDDFTQADIRQALTSYRGPTQAPPSPAAGLEEPGQADWRAHALAALPAVLGTGGAVVGGGGGAIAIPGVGGVPGAMFGGAAGAAAGRGLENMGRRAMGLPANRGLVEQMMAAGGHQVPDYASGLMDMAEQAGLGALFEGGPAKLFGIAGQGPGALERTAAGMAEKGAAKAELKAAKRVKVANAASDITPYAAEAERQSRELRKLRGGNVGQALKEADAAGHEMTLNDMINHVEKSLTDQFGASPGRDKLLSGLRKTVKTVMQEHSLGALKGNKLVFNMSEANVLKRLLKKELLGHFKEGRLGRGPSPTMLSEAHDAVKSFIESKIPNIEKLNQEAGAAIRSNNAVRQKIEAARDPIVRGLTEGSQERKAMALARLSSEEGAFSPRMTLHGPQVDIPSGGRLAGATARLLGRPGVGAAGQTTPEILNFLMHIMQDQPMPDSTGGAP